MDRSIKNHIYERSIMLKEYLKELSLLDGISSREEEIIDYMYEKFKHNSKNVTVDRIGNITCKFDAKPSIQNPKKVVLFAHMDEVGMMIRKIDEHGFLFIERVGGTYTKTLPGTRVKVVTSENKKIDGVVGVKSYHFASQKERETLSDIQELYIDIGATSFDNATDIGVHVGDYAVYSSEFVELNNAIVSGKAMDDRVGCAVLLDLADKLKNKALEWEVYLVACVQEEFNIRGVLPAIKRISPQVSIGIDITISCDTPEGQYNDIKLGGGVALTYMNYHGKGTLAGVLPDIKLVRHLENICTEHGLEFQREIARGVITENAFLIFEGEGISVANVSIPARNVHTSIEAIHMKDVQATSDLLYQFTNKLNMTMDFGKIKEEQDVD